jgi:hypothetical protein
MIEVCALWERTSEKAGTYYSSGPLKSIPKLGDKFFIFPKKSGTHPDAPDFTIMSAPSEEQDTRPVYQQQQAKTQKEFFNTQPQDVKYGQQPPAEQKELPF